MTNPQREAIRNCPCGKPTRGPNSATCWDCLPGKDGNGKHTLYFEEEAERRRAKSKRQREMVRQKAQAEGKLA